MVQGSELNSLAERTGVKNPFKKQWEDKPYKSVTEKKVPKNFYRKHRENMVNESEEIARMIIS